MELLDNIKKYANQMGLTLRQVNDKAGLGTNAIYRWKNQKPSFEKINKVAKVLGVSTDLLLGNEDKPKKREADLDDDDVIFTYEGRQIPKRDLQIIKNMIEAMKKEDD